MLRLTKSLLKALLVAFLQQGPTLKFIRIALFMRELSTHKSFNGPPFVCGTFSGAVSWSTALLYFPGKELAVKDIEVSSNTDVTMLGVAQCINWCRSGSGVVVEIPALWVDEVPYKYAYGLKIRHVKSL